MNIKKINIFLITLSILILLGNTISLGEPNVSVDNTLGNSTIVGCSKTSTQDIGFIKTSLMKQGHSLPKYIVCNNFIGKHIWLKSSDKNKKRDFEDVEGFYVPLSNGESLIFSRQDSKYDSFTRILTHELGHYNHNKKLGLEVFTSINDKPIPPELTTKIKFLMGDYAATSRREFVAEYFSLSYMGVKFPEELTRLYVECKGS